MRLVITLCSIFFCALTTPVSAVICTWIGGESNWNNPGNWSCGIVPGVGDRVSIFTNNVDITIDIDVMVDTLLFDGNNTRLIGTNSITVLKEMTWQFGIIEVDITTEDMIIEDNTFQSKFLNETLTINGYCEYNFTNWLWIPEGGSLVNNGTIHSDDIFQINGLPGSRGTFINHGSFIKEGTGGSNSWIPITNHGTMTFQVGDFGSNQTLLNYGTLHIEESLIQRAESEIENHGLLKGNGSITLSNTYDLSNGIIAPGSSPGQLSFRHGSSTVTLDGEIQIEVQDDSGPGTGHDHINVTSANVVLGGVLNVVETGAVPDGVYTIIEAMQSCSGSFTGVNLPPDYSLNQTATQLQLVKGEVLPVRLISFEVQSVVEGVELSWTTASEQNNAGFAIEKSADANHWEQIAFVEGRGHSQEINHYWYHDRLPSASKIYYRLIQEDFDGSRNYSEIRILQSRENQQLIVTPNPAHRYVTLQNTKHPIMVFDHLGRSFQQAIFPDEKSQIDVQNWPPGTYWMVETGSLRFARIIVF